MRGDYKELCLRLCLATGGVKIYNFQVFDGSLIKKPIYTGTFMKIIFKQIMTQEVPVDCMYRAVGK